MDKVVCICGRQYHSYKAYQRCECGAVIPELSFVSKDRQISQLKKQLVMREIELAELRAEKTQ